MTGEFFTVIWLDGSWTQVHKGVAFDGARSIAGHMLSRRTLSNGSMRVQDSMCRVYQKLSRGRNLAMCG